MLTNNHIQERNHIVFYDGDCAFCLRSTQFIFRNNTSKSVFFCSLQSDFCANFIKTHHLPSDLNHQNTLLYWENGQIHTHAKAVFKICGQLRFPYNVFKWAYFLPNFITKTLYSWVARYRLRLSKSQNCMIPSTDFKKRILY